MSFISWKAIFDCLYLETIILFVDIAQIPHNDNIELNSSIAIEAKMNSTLFCKNTVQFCLTFLQTDFKV